MNIVAREYALDIGECAFAPELIQHIPGVTNMIADLLSRRTDPKYAATWAIPQFLANATEITPPPRTSSWWRSLATTGVASLDEGGRGSSYLSPLPLQS